MLRWEHHVSRWFPLARKLPPLDKRHFKAALALANGDGSTKAATSAGVTKRSVNLWRKREDFQRLVEGLQEGLQETAEAALKGYLLDSVRTIGQLATGQAEDADQAVSLRAAFGVLDRVGLPATERKEHSGNVGFSTDASLEIPDDELDAEIEELESVLEPGNLVLVKDGG